MHGLNYGNYSTFKWVVGPAFLYFVDRAASLVACYYAGEAHVRFMVFSHSTLSKYFCMLNCH